MGVSSRVSKKTALIMDSSFRGLTIGDFGTMLS